MENMQLNPEFQAFMNNNPDVLQQFLNIIDAWRRYSGNAVTITPVKNSSDGPQSYDFEQEVELTVNPISLEEINNIDMKYADTTAKEKVFEYIKGFIAGVMFVAG